MLDGFKMRFRVIPPRQVAEDSDGALTKELNRLANGRQGRPDDLGHGRIIEARHRHRRWKLQAGAV